MKIELKSKTEIIDEEEITTWQIDKNDGAIVITLNKLIEDTICECMWVDTNRTYLQVMYMDWDSNELFAIVHTNGYVVRNAIRSLEAYIESLQLFIVEMSGFGLGLEATEYHLAADDWKMAVVNRHGDFVIGPEYSKIYFEDDENVFYANNYNDDEVRYAVNGKVIN